MGEGKRPRLPPNLQFDWWIDWSIVFDAMWFVKSGRSLSTKKLQRLTVNLQESISVKDDCRCTNCWSNICKQQSTVLLLLLFKKIVAGLLTLFWFLFQERRVVWLMGIKREKESTLVDSINENRSTTYTVLLHTRKHSHKHIHSPKSERTSSSGMWRSLRRICCTALPMLSAASLAGRPGIHSLLCT